MSATCPRCETPVPADAPGGLCPRCLLSGAWSSDAGAAGEATGADPKPSGRFVPPVPADLDPLFDDLTFVRLIGRGGMGAVYEARQTRLDRPVAVKILPPEVGRDPAFAGRFLREARTLAKLSHPHVVGVHDFGVTDERDGGPGLYYIVMEYVDGTDLRAVIDAGVTPADVLAVVRQICDALEYAHARGVVHRDVKPENVLLDRDGRVKIADFGLAKLAGTGEAGPADTPTALTRAGQVMGTPHYMAPEQLAGSTAVDHRADIYALGVVFYELLTGELPLGRYEPPSRRAETDPRLDEVVLRALEVEPGKRYQSAGAVRTDVERVGNGPAVGRVEHARSASVAPVPVEVGSHHGLLRFDGAAVRFELDVGIFRKDLREFVIPAASIAGVELRRGLFGGRIDLKAERMADLADVPATSQGRIEADVDRSEVDHAAAFVAAVRRAAGLPSAKTRRSASRHGDHSASPGRSRRLTVLLATAVTATGVAWWTLFATGLLKTPISAEDVEPESSVVIPSFPPPAWRVAGEGRLELTEAGWAEYEKQGFGPTSPMDAGTPDEIDAAASNLYAEYRTLLAEHTTRTAWTDDDGVPWVLAVVRPFPDAIAELERRYRERVRLPRGDTGLVPPQLPWAMYGSGPGGGIPPGEAGPFSTALSQFPFGWGSHPVPLRTTVSRGAGVDGRPGPFSWWLQAERLAAWEGVGASTIEYGRTFVLPHALRGIWEEPSSATESISEPRTPLVAPKP